MALISLGSGYLPLFVALLVAMVLARAAGNSGVTVVQAGVGTILTVSVGNDQAGPDRVIDALLGAGVALAFTQLLFSPDPVRLVRRAETAALRQLADGLAAAAAAVAGDGDQGPKAIASLRSLGNGLADVSQARKVAARSLRHSVVWRWQTPPSVHGEEKPGHLHLLGNSALMLARAALASVAEERQAFRPAVRGLADTVAELADDLGDRTVRQSAVNQAMQTLAIVDRIDRAATAAPYECIPLARMAIRDLMVFAGVDAGRADAAVRSSIAPRSSNPTVPEAHIALTGCARPSGTSGRPARKDSLTQ